MNKRTARKLPVKFLIRKGPWYCTEGHWVRSEPAPRDPLVLVGKEVCRVCRRKRVLAEA